MLKNQTKLSVIIISKNEEKNIGECLESVKWANEIVVIDDESDDKTVAIAKQYTNKVYFHKLSSFAEQKNLAIAKCSNQWILNIDADERVTSGLSKEIQKYISEDKYDGFYIPFKNHLGDYWLKYGGLYPDYHLRLFKKNKGRFSGLIHESVKINGRYAYLREPIIHYTYVDLIDYNNKINNYTTLEAEEMHQNKRKIGFFWPIRCLSLFFNLYFLKQGFRDGWIGLINTVFLSYYNFLKYAKLKYQYHKDCHDDKKKYRDNS